MMGSSSLNSDIPKHELPAEYITKGNNFRARYGAVVPNSGSVQVQGPFGDATIGFLKHFTLKAGDFLVAASRDRIWLVGGGSTDWVDISYGSYPIPEGGQFDWTGAQLGQIMVMNNDSTFPQYFYTTGDMIPLPFNEHGSWADNEIPWKLSYSPEYESGS